MVMHVGIVLMVDFADLTLGMVMIHLFTFDPDWLAPRRDHAAAHTEQRELNDEYACQ